MEIFANQETHVIYRNMDTFFRHCGWPSVCIDKVVLDEFGNPRNSGGCVPTTECPSRPEQ